MWLTTGPKIPSDSKLRWKVNTMEGPIRWAIPQAVHLFIQANVMQGIIMHLQHQQQDPFLSEERRKLQKATFDKSLEILLGKWWWQRRLQCVTITLLRDTLEGKWQPPLAPSQKFFIAAIAAEEVVSVNLRIKVRKAATNSWLLGPNHNSQESVQS